MSGLKDRLRRLTKSNTANDNRTRSLPVAEDTVSIDQHAEREKVAWASIDAELCTIAGGTFIKRTRRYPLHASHGLSTLGALWQMGEHLGLLSAPQQKLVSPAKLLFLDTETTGLGVGAGNVPFMIGYGYVEQEQFIVEQLFIRDPAEEHYALTHLQSVVERFSHIVTFNGRTFDWPVIKNRYILHRMSPPQECAHIDLLYPSRSLWRRTLESCRLGMIEEHILGVQRIDDLPGSQAPMRYVEFLSSSRVEDIEDVFLHNERDILSLATLAIHFDSLLNDSLDIDTDDSVTDAVRLAWWLDKLGRREIAERVLAVSSDAGSKLDRAQMLEAASLWKRWRRYDQAARLWVRYCRQYAGTLHALEPMIELAVYHEHRSRNIEQALIWAEKARTMIERRLSLGRGRQSDRQLLQEIDHRLNRLRRKQTKPQQAKMEFLL